MTVRSKERRSSAAGGLNQARSSPRIGCRSSNMFFLHRWGEDRTIGGAIFGDARAMRFYADHALRMLMFSAVRRRCSCIHNQMIRTRRRPTSPIKTHHVKTRAGSAGAAAAAEVCGNGVTNLVSSWTNAKLSCRAGFCDERYGFTSRATKGRAYNPNYCIIFADGRSWDLFGSR